MVEQWVVVPSVVGSSPICHPKNYTALVAVFLIEEKVLEIKKSEPRQVSKYEID